jgi:hypothetical protein
LRSADKALLVLLAACAAATLFHHAHNAEFLDEYPNMPAWLSRASVYGAWLIAGLIGAAGYVLLRQGYRVLGLVLLGAYACYGLDGLAHYALAPMSAHTAAMNLSIWLEAAAGAGLLLAIAKAR